MADDFPTVPGDWNKFQQDPFYPDLEPPPDNPTTTQKICVSLPVSWLKYVMGGLYSLTYPDRWQGTDSEKIQYGQWAEEVLDDLLSEEPGCWGGYTVGAYVGEIKHGFWSSEPENTLPLLGGVYLKAAYPELWDVLSGINNNPFEEDANNFRLPHMGYRSLVGQSYLQDDPFDGPYTGEIIQTGEWGGEKEHSLTADENGPHSHFGRYTRGASGPESSRPLIQVNALQQNTLDHLLPSGEGDPHNNMHPHLAAFCVIVYKVNTPMTHTFELRQNPTNPYLLEQSIDNGVFFTAFDYEKIEKECKPSGSGNVADITIINNYITDINNVYDGSVTSVYVDATYAGNGNPDDRLRDESLCYVIDSTLRFVFEALEASKEREEPPGLTDLISDTFDFLWSNIDEIAIGGAFSAATGSPVVAMIAAGWIYGKMESEWRNDLLPKWETWKNGTPTGNEQDEMEDLICCVFSQLKGSTISESAFYNAVSTCLSPTVGDTPFEEIIKGLAIAILGDTELWPVFLDQLQLVYTAQTLGVVLDCPCLGQYQSFFLTGASDTHVQTDFTSVLNETYRVYVSGEYTYASGGKRDAFYGSSDNWSSHFDYQPNGVIRIDGWATLPFSYPAYDSGHNYVFDIDGTGAKFDFWLFDTDWGDNSGGLNVTIEQL